MNTDNGALDFEATINNESLKRSILETRRQISGLGQIAEQEGKRMDTAFSGAAKTIAAMAGAGMMLGFARQIVTVRGEFQQLDVAFNTMLGSKSKADALMAQIVDTAAKTPFTLTQVANGAKQLLAYQVAAEDVNDTVIRLGNIAAGVSVPLDRLILAYGQVKAKGKLQGDDMRQFAESGVPIVHELAKVMGVADKEISKMVESGKIGFPEVQKVIQNLTDEGGMFYNLMEKQSKTLTGQISNLEDAWARMLNKIGESNEGFLSSIITGATGAVEHYQEIIDILVPIVAAYGAYKAVIIATAAAQKAAAGLTFVKEYMAMGRALGFATANQLAFNRAALANPYALVAAALVGLSLAIYNVASEQTAAEKAQESYNKAMDDAGNKITEEKSKITSLISVINDESNSREYRNKKLKELIAISPELLNSLTLETLKTSEGKAAIDAYVLSLEKKIKIQTLEAELTYSIKRMQDAQAGKENLSWWDKTKAVITGPFKSDNLNKTGWEASKDEMSKISAINNQEVIKAEKDLQEKIKADISSMTNNNKNAGSDVADVVINAEYWEQQVKDAKDALDKLDTRSKTFGKDQADLLAKIAKGEAEINRIRAKKQTKKSEVKQFEDELNQKKIMYEAYYAYVELLGEDVAKKQFEKLLKNGDSYTAYLEKKQGELTTKAGKGKLSDAEKENLFNVNRALNEAKGIKNPFKKFQEELSRINNEAKTTTEYLDRISKLRNDINTGKTKLNPEEQVRAVGIIDLNTSEERRKMLDNIYSNYKTNFQLMEELQKRYNEDVKSLEKELTNAVTKEAKDRVKQTIAARKQAYSEDISSLIEQSQEFRKYFGDISELSISTLNNTVNALKLMIQEAFDAGQITYDKYTELMKKINTQQSSSMQGRGFELMFGSGNKKGGFANMMFGEGDMQSKMGQFTNMFKGAEGATQGMSSNMSSMASKAAGAIAIVDAIIKGIYQTIKAVTEVADGIADLEDSYGQETRAQNIKDWTSVANTVNEGVMGSWNKLKSGDVMGSISQSLSMPLQVWSTINKIHDSRIERSIQKHKEAVSDLQRAYNQLQRAVEDALGAAVYDNEKASIQNLKRQQDEYRAMINDEKRKKKTDNGKIKEYQDAINNITNQIEDTVNGLAENILGGTVKDIASQLGNAMIEAFAKGEDAAEAWKNKVDDIVGDVIRKMIIQKIVEEPVGMIINKYLSKWVDGEGNFAGFDTVMSDATKMGDELNSLSTSISGILNKLPADIQKYLTNSNSNKNSLSGSISATITEDTATLISGYINAIRINQLNSINIMNSMLMQLNIIAGNTAYNKFLESIDKSLAKLTVDNLRARG